MKYITLHSVGTYLDAKNGNTYAINNDNTPDKDSMHNLIDMSEPTWKKNNSIDWYMALDKNDLKIVNQTLIELKNKKKGQKNER